MPTFKNANGVEFSIRFNGLLLNQLREDHGIDLGDITGPTYVRLKSDMGRLTVAVCFLCGAQCKERGITREQFAEALTGEALESAHEALWGAAKLFLSPKQWSVLQQESEKWEQLLPLAMLNDLPETVRTGLMAELMPSFTSGALDTLTANGSGGRDVTPLEPATN